MTGTEVGSSVCSCLSPRDPLGLNAVGWMVIVMNVSELLDVSDPSQSLCPWLFPGWLCWWSKSRLGREEWGQCRETQFLVEYKLTLLLWLSLFNVCRAVCEGVARAVGGDSVI